jgi:hypothetical protein
MMEEETPVKAEIEIGEEETPADIEEEAPTKVYEVPLGELKGRTDPKKKSVEIWKYDCREGKDSTTKPM